MKPKIWQRLLGMTWWSLLLACSSASVVNMNMMKPATLDLPGVKEIAIADFQGQDRSGSQIATLVQSMLMEVQHYGILERDKLRRVLEEQNLGMSGVVDDATAAQVGQLLGVDALVFGEVTTYEVEPDKRITRQVKERRGTGKFHWVEQKDRKTGKTKKVKKEIMEEVYVPKTHWVRKGTVAINFRVVDVETGRLLAAHSDSRSYDSDKERSFGSARENQASLKPEGQILADLSRNICREFTKMISPYEVTEQRVLEPGKGNILVGVKYAETGLWPEAMEAWEQAIRETPDEPAAYYNMGLAYELDGMLDDAEKMYQKAVSLKQKTLYMEAVARIRKIREEQDRLQKQLLEREK